MIAAREGRARSLQTLFELGADLFAQAPDGQSALEIALHHGHLDCSDYVSALLAQRELDSSTPRGPARPPTDRHQRKARLG
jgi:ankyrin repeat protein